MRVYVLNMRGQPLMPCKPAKARHLLRDDKARVVKRQPFTIQLKYPTGEAKQNISLGIDSGYQNIGFSAVSDKDELISGEVKLDNGNKKRLDDRRIYRRNRRNRLRYRKPRFSNRKRKGNWLPPSIERRYQTHLKLISKIKEILPISKVMVEVGKFDIQKIENPNIKGKGYQQGSMYQYRNRIAYLMAREKGKCQYCGREYKKGDPWRLHHIWGRDYDRPKDWALLHESCHKKLHARGEEYKLRKQKPKSYRGSTFMSIIRKRFLGLYNITYGNITYQDRLEQGLEKSHANDAFVIAGGNGQSRCNPYQVEQKRKNNRCLQKNRKGFKPSIRKKRYSLQPKDLVKIDSRIFVVKGIHCYGRQIKLQDGFGIIISKAVKKLDKYIFHQKTLIWSIFGSS